MENNQELGGTRQSSPLDNEMSYPLTKDEYLLIEENLSADKLSNLESFLLSTFCTAAISLFFFWLTGSVSKTVTVGKIDTIEINTTQVVLLIIYGAISLGTLLGFIVSKVMKKRSKPAMGRLSEKILQHLNKTTK